MKKLLLIITAFIISINSNAMALNSENKTLNELSIKKLVHSLNYHSNKQHLAKIKSFYSPNFTSGDGFSNEIFFKMVEDTFKSYDKIKYSVKVKEVEINDKTARVNILDKTTAKLKSDGEIKDVYGDLEGVCNYIINLEKQANGKWLIVSDEILSETTSLKYGEAKFAKMEMFAPTSVKEDSEYSINLKMEAPKNTFVIASLNRENIVYPPIRAEEAFRKLSATGELERIVRSNSKGLNEYAVASIGFTRIHLGEDLTSIQMQMSGLAFLMNRVNIENTPNTTSEAK